VFWSPEVAVTSSYDFLTCYLRATKYRRLKVDADDSINLVTIGYKYKLGTSEANLDLSKC